MSVPQCFQDLVGKSIPDSLCGIDEDSFDPGWIQSEPNKVRINVYSDYRLGVYMTLELFLDEKRKTKDIYWSATWVSHGPPRTVAPQARETKQTSRIISKIFVSTC